MNTICLSDLSLHLVSQRKGKSALSACLQDGVQEAKRVAGNLLAAKGCQVAGDSSKPSYTCGQGKQASKSPLIH